MFSSQRRKLSTQHVTEPTEYNDRPWTHTTLLGGSSCFPGNARQQDFLRCLVTNKVKPFRRTEGARLGDTKGHGEGVGHRDSAELGRRAWLCPSRPWARGKPHKLPEFLFVTSVWTTASESPSM